MALGFQRGFPGFGLAPLFELGRAVAVAEIGEIDGALLACAIPVKPARTYVGSIWLADGHEALRLMHQGQLDVICLPRAPGTWRVIEPVQSQIRYDRVGPIPDIPRDF